MRSSFARDLRYSLGRIRRTHPALKHISIVTVALLLYWLHTIHQGERAIFASKIDACEWPTSETWPADAQPHHAVLIADPQLVDAHTYPGRPWPLSSLTEIYTDRYMARNFKLINAQLDPDSIIFLGDMFDGGREWAPAKARPLTAMQQWAMNVRSPETSNVPKEMKQVRISDPGWIPENKGGMVKRQVEQGTEAVLAPTPTVITKDIDLGAYEHGEGGRWRGYGNDYWEKEYKRFGRIFFAKDQLYSAQPHEIDIVGEQPQDTFNVDNGAPGRSHDQFLLRARTRNLIASLPGNHDLGFGSGVQLSVRARYKWHFGEMNRVDVVGNHTFVFIDALSLAAWSQFEANGQESTAKEVQDRSHIYAAAQNFLDDLPATVNKASKSNLDHFYPQGRKQNTQRKHTIIDVDEVAERETKPSHKGGRHQLPAILLSHVPLYRDADTWCGPQRERGRALSLTGGYQYQNVLTKTLTNTIISKLTSIGPLKEIFSGDDHDYCDVTHASNQRAVREETVKSFSWAMGVRHPGFLLVSLYNPIDAEGKSIRGGVTIETKLCLLPDQLGIFIRYGTLAGLTLIVLLLRAIILALRAKQDVEEEEVPTIEFSKLISSGLTKVKQLTNGYKPVSKQRHRASSSALKPPSNNNLSVQRSANARTRSVSPGIGFGTASPFQTAPLIDQAGYYPTLRHNSNPGSDDEESRIGDMDYLEDDTQSKWRKRQRPKGKLRRALDEFVGSLMLVGGIASCYYIVLIRTG